MIIKQTPEPIASRKTGDEGRPQRNAIIATTCLWSPRRMCNIIVSLVSFLDLHSHFYWLAIPDGIRTLSIGRIRTG
jgi:hypothetical protein